MTVFNQPLLNIIDRLTSNEIKNILRNGYKSQYDDPYPPGLLRDNPRPASVLMPLLRIDTHWEMLFIRRTSIEGDIHSGQVAFPGGGAEPDDQNIAETALREAQEEIGLDPSDVEILGHLGNFRTISNYLVTPIVGVIPWPYQLKPDPAEVNRVFSIPIAWLVDPSNRYVEQRKLPAPNKPVEVIYFQPYQGEMLWGASARFTLDFLKLLIKKIQS